MTWSRQRWMAGALCLLLAIAHTWPLALAPGTHSRTDKGDAQLNAWILAWVAHQLPRAPARLFDANNAGVVAAIAMALANIESLWAPFTYAR